MRFKYIGSLYLLAVIIYLLFFLPIYSTQTILNMENLHMPVRLEEQGRVRFFDMQDLYIRNNPVKAETNAVEEIIKRFRSEQAVSSEPSIEDEALGEYINAKENQKKPSIGELLQRFRRDKRAETDRCYYYRFDMMAVEIGLVTLAFSAVALIFGKK